MRLGIFGLLRGVAEELKAFQNIAVMHGVNCTYLWYVRFLLHPF